ncbi:hypothetical protein [Jannaschia seohaensis]|uniref:Uncharacterized protein n=1 Tax=Jannaschia seohaensis TaxID=475081 RepID=A0A2Y9AAN7_9RHOB|nr:hypothetical protein [Jannaschia seohaensis]PWJ20825.1 hypothetical protein BCF38_10271 [Jannaschia seohaensis]SSA41235.1 hypothetical protein SAMN05421539_10271 [Jannaschia seohaensis]
MARSMPDLFLDSAAIGVVVSTVSLEAILLLDPIGMGAVLAGLGPIVLTLIWLHVIGMAAPLATLVLLMGETDTSDDL